MKSDNPRGAVALVFAIFVAAAGLLFFHAGCSGGSGSGDTVPDTGIDAGEDGGIQADGGGNGGVLLVPSTPYPSWGDMYDSLGEIVPHWGSGLFNAARMQLWTVKPAVFADLPSSGDQPIYVFIYGHHYAGGGGIYTDTEVLRAMATEIADRGLPFTFFTDGIACEQHQTDDPGFFDFINSLGFDVGYHGEQDHDPEPRILPAIDAPPQLQASLVDGLSWDDAVDAIVHRYSHGIDAALTDTGQGFSRLDHMLQAGATDPSRPGGLALVESLFGRSIAMITTHSTEVASAEAAFGSMSDYRYVQSTGPLNGKYWTINLQREDLVEEASRIGGDGSFFWFMGKLQEKNFPGHGYEYLPADSVLPTLQGLDRTRPQYVMLPVTSRTPAPPDFSDFYAALDVLVANLGSFAPAQAVSASEMPDLFVPLQIDPAYSRTKLRAIADFLVTSWTDRPPDYIDLGNDDTYALVDALAGLASALSTYRHTGALSDSMSTVTLYGPIGEVPAPASQSFYVPQAAILDLATNLANTAEATGRWPTTITHTGGETINIAEALLLMAQMYLQLDGQ